MYGVLLRATREDDGYTRKNLRLRMARQGLAVELFSRHLIAQRIAGTPMCNTKPWRQIVKVTVSCLRNPSDIKEKHLETLEDKKEKDCSIKMLAGSSYLVSHLLLCPENMAKKGIPLEGHLDLGSPHRALASLTKTRRFF